MNLSCGDSRELMALAVALSMLLAAFFTVVGDTLALFALQPDLCQPDQPDQSEK